MSPIFRFHSHLTQKNSLKIKTRTSDNIAPLDRDQAFLSSLPGGRDTYTRVHSGCTPRCGSCCTRENPECENDNPLDSYLHTPIARALGLFCFDSFNYRDWRGRFQRSWRRSSDFLPTKAQRAIKGSNDLIANASEGHVLNRHDQPVAPVYGPYHCASGGANSVPGRGTSNAAGGACHTGARRVFRLPRYQLHRQMPPATSPVPSPGPLFAPPEA